MTLSEQIAEYRERLNNNTKHFIIDFETKLIDKTDKKTVFSHPPELVLLGHCWGYIEPPTGSGSPTAYLINSYVKCIGKSKEHKHTLTIGHNVMFDLCCIPEVFKLPNLMVWDTQKAEYLFSNQTVQYVSLDDLAAGYGIPGKDSEVSDMIKKGICPSTIPEAKLAKYLTQDVTVTRDIFYRQLERFNKMPKNWQNMFISQMIYLVNTTRASLNGMAVDTEEASRQMYNLQGSYINLDLDLKEMMRNISGYNSPDFWNPSSNQHVSALLYGGTLVDDTGTECIGTYKTGPKAGTPKYRRSKTTLEIKGKVGSSIADKADEKTLLGLSAILPTGSDVKLFIELLLEYRDVGKTLKTYYEGYLTYAKHDGKIHCKYNHCATPTGRLTCSEPNLQNIKG